MPGRDDLYTLANTPEHMVFVWWDFGRGGDARFEELVVDFTIHNNVDLRGRSGLYLMVGYAAIADVPFYFGLQTDVHSGTLPFGSEGKGVIFSRWGTRDLEHARWDSDQGWNQSSGHEGDFIGVRRSYDWREGSYRMRLAPEESGPRGVWYGLWITDLQSGIETWAGSLRFPRAAIAPPLYSTVEVYGQPIRPIDIPRWRVSIQRPVFDDGKPAIAGTLGYAMFHSQIKNADIGYDSQAGAVQMEVGGLTEQVGRPGRVAFR